MPPRCSDLLIFALCMTAGASWPNGASAASVQATVAFAGLQGPGEEYGAVRLSDDHGGLRILPKLRGLPEGRYTLELHQGSSCETTYESHGGPEGQSPLMPVAAGAADDLLRTTAGEALSNIVVGPNGKAETPVAVPSVANASQFKGRALIVRGERLLCGVLR